MVWIDVGYFTGQTQGQLKKRLESYSQIIRLVMKDPMSFAHAFIRIVLQAHGLLTLRVVKCNS